MKYTRKRKALIDASSAIILYKADIIQKLIILYDFIVPRTVFDELTSGGCEGAEYFKKISAGDSVTINEISREILGKYLSPQIMKLDRGERDAVLLLLSGIGDFIIIDDKEGCSFCRDNNLHYINALLVPVILYFSGDISSNERCELMKQIISIGHYAEWVIDYALNSKKSDLEFFINS